MVTVALAVAMTMQAVDLSRFVGKDLQHLSSVDWVQWRKAKLALPIPKEEANFTEPEPHWVKPYRAGSFRWLLLEIRPAYDIPGVSSFVAYAFDAGWQVKKRFALPTGYRLEFEKEELSNDPSFGRPLLTIQVRSQGPFMVVEGKKRRPAFHPESGIRETYAFDEQGCHLIRMTTGDGKLLSNSFTWSWPSIGPNVFGRSRADWAGDLASADPVSELTCLIWLSGEHLNSKDWRGKGVSREPVEESKTYESLRADPKVHARVKALAKSPNPWVSRQAAYTLERLAMPLREISSPF